jgi:DNA-binding response OmpR family regulator
MSEDGASGPQILVVDDSVEDGELYREFLARRGYLVTVVRDGEEAVSTALNGDFDLVLLDLMLPKLDGLQVLTLLRSYPRTRWLPVLTLSARTGEHMRAAAVDAGADMALEKPFPPDELARTIEVFLQRGKRKRRS